MLCLFRLLCWILPIQCPLIVSRAQVPPSVKADSQAGSGSLAPDNNSDTPVALLEFCAKYAGDLNPTDRAVLMFRVADTAARHRMPESTGWARRAFSLAAGLPKDWNRMALEKNDLLALAQTRPQEALQLLGTIEGPDFTGDTPVAEDPRADAARQIFADAFKAGGLSTLPSLDSVSRYLGQTGQYPYAAWGTLFSTFFGADPDDLRQELRVAVFFYSRAENRTRSQDEDYLEMAEAVQSIAAASEMREAVDAGVNRLESEKPPDNEVFLAKSGPPESRVSFDNEQTALLYRWLPLAQKFDPVLCKSIVEKVGTIPAKESGQQVSAVIIGDKGAVSPAVKQDIADRMQEELVIGEASKAPELAMADANRIVSLAIRSDALAQAALAVTDENAAWRGKFLAASKSALDDATPKDVSYLHAFADLTASCDDLRMKDQALAGVRAGLDLGVEIVSESADSHPETPAMLLRGYADLAQLVAIGMRLDSAPILRAVRNLANGAVKVNLMVDIADALASSPGPSA